MAARMVHVSIDDVLDVLRELAEDGDANMWEHAVFRALRRLHDRHVAVISLYLFFGDGRRLGWSRRGAEGLSTMVASSCACSRTSRTCATTPC